MWPARPGDLSLAPIVLTLRKLTPSLAARQTSIRVLHLVAGLRRELRLAGPAPSEVRRPIFHGKWPDRQPLVIRRRTRARLRWRWIATGVAAHIMPSVGPVETSDHCSGALESETAPSDYLASRKRRASLSRPEGVERARTERQGPRQFSVACVVSLFVLRDRVRSVIAECLPRACIRV